MERVSCSNLAFNVLCFTKTALILIERFILNYFKENKMCQFSTNGKEKLIFFVLFSELIKNLLSKIFNVLKKK